MKAKNDSLYKPIRRTTPPFVSFDKGGGKSKTRIIIFPPLTKTSDQSSLVPLCGSASDKEIQMKVTLPIERGSCVEIRAERERERERRGTCDETRVVHKGVAFRSHPLLFRLERRINFIQVTCSPRREREREPRFDTALDCKLVDFMRPWSPINIPSLSSGSRPSSSFLQSIYTRCYFFRGLFE